MRRFFKRISFDWKRLVLPMVIDKQNMTESEQRTAKYFNRAFGIGIFGSCFLLFILMRLPDIKGAVAVAVVWILFYVAFCAIMNSLRLKKSNAGRKPKQNEESFKDLFVNIEDYDVFDKYVCKHYSKERQMRSMDANILLNVLIEKEVLKNNALEPLAQLFINEYYPRGLVRPSTSRSISKTIPTSEKKAKIQAELQRESSKEFK